MGKIYDTLCCSLQITGFSGGVRGIVELEVLNQLQKILEVNIPIMAFFDFVVGTRYDCNPR
jgi:patatin-like phospholipase/acyl hydrolase